MCDCVWQGVLLGELAGTAAADPEAVAQAIGQFGSLTPGACHLHGPAEAASLACLPCVLQAS